MESGLPDTFSLLTLVAVIYFVVNFVRNLVNLGNDPSAKNGVLTQLIVVVSAFVVLIVAAQADIANELVVMNRSLASFDVMSLLLVALAFGSSASALNDFFASRDEYRSSDNPPILGAKEALRAGRHGDAGNG